MLNKIELYFLFKRVLDWFQVFQMLWDSWQFMTTSFPTLQENPNHLIITQQKVAFNESVERKIHCRKGNKFQLEVSVRILNSLFIQKYYIGLVIFLETVFRLAKLNCSFILTDKWCNHFNSDTILSAFYNYLL